MKWQEEDEETIIEHIIGSNKIWKMRKKKVGDVSEQMMDRYRVCAPDALYNIENVLEERRKNAMGMREKYIERECKQGKRSHDSTSLLTAGGRKKKNTSEIVVVVWKENKVKSIQIDSL